MKYESFDVIVSTGVFIATIILSTFRGLRFHALGVVDYKVSNMNLTYFMGYTEASLWINNTHYDDVVYTHDVFPQCGKAGETSAWLLTTGVALSILLLHVMSLHGINACLMVNAVTVVCIDFAEHDFEVSCLQTFPNYRLGGISGSIWFWKLSLIMVFFMKLIRIN